MRRCSLKDQGAGAIALLCAQVEEQLRDNRVIFEQQPGIFLGSEPRSGDRQVKGIVEEYVALPVDRTRYSARMAEPSEF